MSKPKDTKVFSIVMPIKLFNQIRTFAFKNEQKFAASVRDLLKKGLEASKKQDI